MGSVLDNAKRQFLVGWKYLVSFRTSNWQLKDYPIWIRQQNPDLAATPSRLKLFPFVASIINWAAMSAGGNTKEEALQELRTQFDRVRQEKPLPRPGTGLPVEFASQESITRNAELADEFVRRICEVDWAWLSDESSLWDFHSEETNEALYTKIHDVYGVDVSDIESGNIGLILDRIASSRRS